MGLTRTVFALLWMSSTLFAVDALAKQSFAVGAACGQRAIQAGLDRLVSPCGSAKQAAAKNELSLVFVDEASYGPRYIPVEHCGWPDDAGLGLLTVTFVAQTGGDCRIIAVELR